MMLRYSFLIAFVLLAFGKLHSQKSNAVQAIYSGVPWYDNNGNTVSAHGACIVKDKARYYLFGERHSDTSNAFMGFNCYSSADLYNWQFESIALPLQASGKLGPNRVGERVKVMKCPSTGEYVMYMHADTLGYIDQFVGYATSKKISGPYKFQGPLLFNSKPIKKWDMGTFQDKDGNGYVLLHGGDIYKLSGDYKSITEQVNKAMAKGFESPALFRKEGTYYFLGSDLTGWERNDNYYYTATSLKGPWVKQGFFAPEGKLTWNSQTTFVLPIQGSKQTTFMFMGDRWSFPKQNSAATYVWQPLTINGTSISIPQFQPAWKINPSTGESSPVHIGGKIIENNNEQIFYSGKWNHQAKESISDETGTSFTYKFNGKQVGFYSLSQSNGGYAKITITDRKGKIVITSTVDMYSKYPDKALKFLSPVMKKDNYTLKVTVLGERWYWVEKSGRKSGSSGNFITLDKIVVK